ncbi:MAG TPA: redoxin domain-containing protein [Acidimicrobiales bacterium]|jgi:cytochrome c biogenesis protein CcmG/thiol:disulfide interchange protein DsbE|nr:redoxin domain-containing protein [Acidimicrobiales bacterium]HJM96711.1 redoxin domain-containing protein [Acidimicrobiales bacterium]
MTVMKSGIIGLAVLGIAFIVLLATRTTQTNGPNYAIVGQQAPQIQGETVDGEDFELDEILLKNRSLPISDQTWVAVNFFASWCSGCVTEHSELLRFYEEGILRDDGIKCQTELIGVAFNDRLSDIENFFKKYGGDWPVLAGEETNRVAIDFSVLTAPETVLIAPNGLVVKKIVGPVSYDDLATGVTC